MGSEMCIRDSSSSEKNDADESEKNTMDLEFHKPEEGTDIRLQIRFSKVIASKSGWVYQLKNCFVLCFGSTNNVQLKLKSLESVSKNSDRFPIVPTFYRHCFQANLNQPRYQPIPFALKGSRLDEMLSSKVESFH